MITLTNVSKKYGNKSIIKNVSLTINKSDITFIVGTSGAGKTTLLNLIGGLDKPTEGSIFFDGKDIGKDLCSYRAQNIGFVFQDFNLISGLSIVQNVEIAASLSGVQKDIGYITNEIASLGISDLNQKVETLSGGEKQRAAVIRSICKDADIIIADEPTGNLDSNNGNLVLELLQSLKPNKHIVIVSHDMEKAKKYADRIITLSDGIIVNDERFNNNQNIIDTSEENSANGKIKNIKSSFGHTILTLGKNSVDLRKGKIFSIAFVIALTIAALATVINLNQSGNTISQNVNVNYLENDLINLSYSYTPNTGYREMPFFENDIQWISKNCDTKDKVYIYLNENDNWVFSKGSKSSDVCIKQININDLFKNRVLSNDIEGDFITKKNEIILAEDVAKQLFDDNCIGEKVTLNDDNGNNFEYTIVGVNHTKNPFDQIYSFVSSGSIKDLLEEKISNSLFQRQELMTYFTEIQSMSYGGLYGKMNRVENNEKLLYGNFPNSSETVLISSELLLNVFSEFDIDKNYASEDILQGKVSSEDINKIFAKKLALNFNGLFAVYISGIYQSDNIEMRFTDSLITEMQKLDPVGIDIYATNPEQVTAIKDSINEKANFEASTQLETLKENVLSQTRFFSIALILLGTILLLISIALLSSFSKIAVLERKREVAIIKSLGATNRQVLSILLFDSAVITVVSFLLSLVMFAALKLLIPFILPDVELLCTGFPIGLLAIIGFVFAFLIFIQTGGTLRKLVKKMPAELFAQ